MWFETLLVEIATLAVILLTTMYFYFKYKYTYWQKENVPYLTPTFPFGNIKNFVLGVKSPSDNFMDIYNEVKNISKDFGGMYSFTKPSLMLVSPEIIKNIMTKDFGHFHDRGIFYDEENDPLSGHLVLLNGLKWKNMRAKLSPTFTSGKLKMMFHTMLASSQNLDSILDECIKKDEPLNSKDMFARLSTDIIGSCAFGLDCNSLKDPDTEFRKYGKKIFEFDIRANFVNAIAQIAPNLLKLFRVPQIHPDITKFFMNILKQTVDYREKNDVQRKDFLELLIRLKNNQSILDNDMDSNNEGNGITFNEMAAQAFVFFAAGFETTSSTLNFALYELSKNEEIQEKARKEILSTLEKHHGEITYEAIMDLKYTEKILCEVLRMYPPANLLVRECTEDYKIPENGYVIKKGKEVVISTLGLHMDPEHYPNPRKFDPERFSDEQKSERHPFTYLPFGEGPRICIGQRFALLQAKLVLCVLLKNYKFSLHSKTKTPVVFDTQSFFLAPKSTFWITPQKITAS